jgi:TorA maturation chaperone TorD
VSGSAPLQFVASLPAEEVARANFYGLLARLYYAPADGALLEALAGADDMEADGELAVAWGELARAAGETDAETLVEEYETAFVGTGKAPVTLYTSAYSVRYTNEVPLARLREELTSLGFARRAEVAEPEDHIAALCDVMRLLITERKSDLLSQSGFFERWIWPATAPLCDAISNSSSSRFYRCVAGFTQAFFALEHSAFDLI